MDQTHRIAFPSFRRWAFALALALAGLASVGVTPEVLAQTSGTRPIGDRIVASPIDRAVVSVPAFTFDLVPNTAVATCLPQASGKVAIVSRGDNQQLDVLVTGLPANTTFTVFVLQLPHSPFGMAWYQGDITTDAFGVGRAHFAGIFSDETFIMAPGSGAAPIVDSADAAVNPVTAPVHLFHLGMWFDSQADAVAAGCPGGRTPFNGEHAAGIQVLNTTNFADGNGPIGQFGR